MYRICLRYTTSREEAEDVLQEGFLKIFRDIKQYDSDKAAFYTWAKRVVINTSLENIRKKDRRPFLDELNDEALVTPFKEDIISTLSHQELLSYINELPGGYRAVFNMYAIDGYNHKEISAALNISESTSKTQLYKARKKLMALINKIKMREHSNA